MLGLSVGFVQQGLVDRFVGRRARKHDALHRCTVQPHTWNKRPPHTYRFICGAGGSFFRL
jgi:hypothetical protein